jgi:chromosome segregation ATPase
MRGMAVFGAGFALAAAGAIGIELGARSGAAAVPRPDEATLARLEARVRALEVEVKAARRDCDAAEREGADALAQALEAKRELEKVRDRTDDLFGLLDGVRTAASKGGPAGEPGPGLAPSARRPPEAALGAPLADAGAEPYARAVEPSPRELATVKQALAEIRKQEDEEQQKRRDERRKQFLQERLADLQAKIGLSPQQVDGLSAVWNDAQTKREALFQQMRDGTGNPAEMRTAMQTIREESEKAIQSLLTPAQYTDYQKIQEEERPRGPRFFGPGGPPPGP